MWIPFLEHLSLLALGLMSLVSPQWAQMEHLSLLALVHLALVSPQRAPLAVALAPMAVALGLAPTLAWLNYPRPLQKAL